MRKTGPLDDERRENEPEVLNRPIPRNVQIEADPVTSLLLRAQKIAKTLLICCPAGIVLVLALSAAGRFLNSTTLVEALEGFAAFPEMVPLLLKAGLGLAEFLLLLAAAGVLLYALRQLWAKQLLQKMGNALADLLLALFSFFDLADTDLEELLEAPKQPLIDKLFRKKPAEQAAEQPTMPEELPGGDLLQDLRAIQPEEQNDDEPLTKVKGA